MALQLFNACYEDKHYSTENKIVLRYEKNWEKLDSAVSPDL